MKDSGEIFYALSLVFRLGITTFFFIFGGVLLGFYMDKTFNTRPLFTLGGTLIGVLGGFYWTYREVTRMNKKN